MEIVNNKTGRVTRHVSEVLGRLLSGRAGKMACALVLLAFFGTFNASIAAKESLLVNGRRVVLALAPVDPLSLMQGFYMELDFPAGRSIEQAMQDRYGYNYGYGEAGPGERERRGLAVMAESDGVYHFVRLHDQRTPLAEGEQLLAFKIIYGRYRESAQISGGSFFFEEGLAALYDRARFAELRVAEDGTALVTNLLDGSLRVIDKSMLKE
ncbi:MAG: GDYXXLXY domain-containing protein [Deltaproteobacteria bacterium]|jgi:uncharacterized membrane-anchored protein|nr:GDYXXLXY domain-containing protein [Deltaproteobacteria bacterium]